MYKMYVLEKKNHLHFTSSVFMLSNFLSPVNTAVHLRVFLWSILEGVKLREDVIFHWPLDCWSDWLLSAPLWLQVRLGGSEGQEWSTEQVVVTFFPALIPSGMDSVGNPESAVEVKTKQNKQTKKQKWNKYHEKMIRIPYIDIWSTWKKNIQCIGLWFGRKLWFHDFLSILTPLVTHLKEHHFLRKYKVL